VQFLIRSRWDTAALYPSSRLLSPERTKLKTQFYLYSFQAFDILGYDSAFRSLRSASSRERLLRLRSVRQQGPGASGVSPFLTVELDEQNTDLRGIFSVADSE
jgi:hypothetical protein